MEASIKNKKIYVMIYKKDNNLQTFLNINSEHPTSIKKKYSVQLGLQELK